jgi:pyruvate formate lyase activating enzyme
VLLDSRGAGSTGSDKAENDLKGLVFNIQRYSIHDGPGIRTTIFFKGCPLRCKWCSNPESIGSQPEILVREARCNGCRRCIEVCSPGALSLASTGLWLDRKKCDLCLKCIDSCWEDAIEVAGRFMSLDQVIDECRRDELFYHNSGGGITLSGGEPLLQPEFALAILDKCKALGLNTALDTCGHVPWNVLEKALESADLVLFDIKHLDADEHRDGTGTDNRLILANLEKAMNSGKARIWIRVPVIPGYNDSDQYMEGLARILSSMKAEKVSILGYHELGRPKYQSLGKAYQLSGRKPMSEERLGEIIGIFKSKGLDATAGY